MLRAWFFTVLSICEHLNFNYKSYFSLCSSQDRELSTFHFRNNTVGPKMNSEGKADLFSTPKMNSKIKGPFILSLCLMLRWSNFIPPKLALHPNSYEKGKLPHWFTEVFEPFLLPMKKVWMYGEGLAVVLNSPTRFYVNSVEMPPSQARTAFRNKRRS